MTCPHQRVRVKVGGEWISTDWVETRINNEGPAHINRLTEFHFPAEWDGEDQQSKVNAFSPSEQSEYDIAEVYWQEPHSGQYVLDHVGFVRGVGGHGDRKGVLRAYIADPSQMVTAIPFSKSYNRPTTEKVLTDVAERFSEATPFNPTVGTWDLYTIGGADNDPNLTTAQEGLGEDTGAIQGDGVLDMAGDLIGDAGRLAGRVITKGTPSGRTVKTSRNFKKNAHTILDALEWVCKASSGRWYFSATNPLKLTFDNDESESTHFDATAERQYVGDNNLKNGMCYVAVGGNGVDVLNNDALAEVFPVNTVQVFGISAGSLLGHQSEFLPSDKFPAVKVQDPVLVSRANGREIEDQIIKTQAKTLAAAEEKAKGELKDKIESGGEGDIEMKLRPDALVGDTITAFPECENWVPNADLTPIEYNITGIRHVKSAYEEDGAAFDGHSFFTVAPRTDTTDYEVVESEMREQ